MTEFNPLKSHLLNKMLVQVLPPVEQPKQEQLLYVPTLQEGLTDGGRMITDIDEFRSAYGSHATILQISPSTQELIDKLPAQSRPVVGDTIIIQERAINEHNYFYLTNTPNKNFTGHLLVDLHSVISKY